jgi:hypothetical protein
MANAISSICSFIETIRIPVHHSFFSTIGLTYLNSNFKAYSNPFRVSDFVLFRSPKFAADS